MLGTLLSMMNDGQFHSGEKLGEALGVSRAAVWKALSRLEMEGYPLQRVRGKGYRIPKGAVLLDLQQIKSSLVGNAASHWAWHLHQEIDSTNAEALRLIAGQGMQPVVCISEQQTAGRGRRGRSWVSPYAQNIYMTLVEPFTEGAQGLEGLSLMVGIVLAEALEQCGHKGVQLKWPNDLLHDGKKLAGILIEISGDLTSECVVVIGLGVNVLMTAEAGERVDQSWTSLLRMGGEGSLDRNTLIACFAQRFHEALLRFRRDGFTPFMPQWDSRDAWVGRPVKVVSGAKQIEGVHRGVSSNGALQLETAEGVLLVNGGEVSLRVNDAA